MRTSSLGLRPAVSRRIRSRSSMRRDGLAHLAGRGDDLHGQVDDVGIGPQLFDRGDAIGVDGDQPHAALFPQAVMGGQLGDGGGLADAGRPDQGRQAAASRGQADRARPRRSPPRSSGRSGPWPAAGRPAPCRGFRGGGARPVRGPTSSLKSESSRSVKRRKSSSGKSGRPPPRARRQRLLDHRLQVAQLALHCRPRPAASSARPSAKRRRRCRGGRAGAAGLAPPAAAAAGWAR